VSADPEEDPPLEPAVASLQAAARQLIVAARGLLDAAEAAVDDPKLVRDAVGAIGDLAQEAARMASAASCRTAGPDPARDGEASDDDDDGGVQHIVVD